MIERQQNRVRFTESQTHRLVPYSSSLVIGHRWVTWTTSEGPVRPTRLEHAILLAGYTGEKLIVNNPLAGRQEQVSQAPFIAAYGVALKPGTLAPSQVRLAGRRPCHRLNRCPACWSTVASAASGGRVALRKAALES